MTPAKFTFKSTALMAALSIAATTALPVASASAHDRRNPASHGGQHMTKKQHRQFHNQWGRGNHGAQAHRSHQQRHAHKGKKKRNNNGELIAAGIIGLAIGAIIASEGNQRREPAPAPVYQPYPSNNYYGEPEYQNYSQPQPVPLDQYQTRTPTNTEPHVITFNESSSLEPWTQGWRDWCTNRYRSFNPQTGTFRGYDGLDHFCVPK